MSYCIIETVPPVLPQPCSSVKVERLCIIFTLESRRRNLDNPLDYHCNDNALDYEMQYGGLAVPVTSMDGLKNS